MLWGFITAVLNTGIHDKTSYGNVCAANSPLLIWLIESAAVSLSLRSFVQLSTRELACMMCLGGLCILNHH